jgi:hypothetical protein
LPEGVKTVATSSPMLLYTPKRAFVSPDEQQQKFITRVPMTIKSAKEALMNLEPGS